MCVCVCVFVYVCDTQALVAMTLQAALGDLRTRTCLILTCVCVCVCDTQALEAMTLQAALGDEQGSVLFSEASTRVGSGQADAKEPEWRVVDMTLNAKEERANAFLHIT